MCDWNLISTATTTQPEEPLLLLASLLVHRCFSREPTSVLNASDVSLQMEVNPNVFSQSNCWDSDDKSNRINSTASIFSFCVPDEPGTSPGLRPRVGDGCTQGSVHWWRWSSLLFVNFLFFPPHHPPRKAPSQALWQWPWTVRPPCHCVNSLVSITLIRILLLGVMLIHQNSFEILVIQFLPLFTRLLIFWKRFSCKAVRRSHGEKLK